MPKRPTTGGRSLFYTRDSGGEHENTPGEHVRWAQRTSSLHCARFTGTPEQIERMNRTGSSAEGDIFSDYGVTGNLLSRPGLDALLRTAEGDLTVTHVLIPGETGLRALTIRLKASSLKPGFAQWESRLCSWISLPLGRGPRDMGEMICGLFDYDKAGKDRRELAQKMLYAQLKLAKSGFSTGGRPPYGFIRMMVRDDGTDPRLLEDGVWVKKAGHHVIWLPNEDETEWAVFRRVIQLLATTPASRVAALLTSEGVPTPDHGRMRTDGGVKHPTSGVWSTSTCHRYRAQPTAKVDGRI
jgi:hypothetical protein